MKIQPRLIVMFGLLLVAYSAINGYLGWHAAEWLAAVGIGIHPALFWIPFALVAYGYILGRTPLPKGLHPLGRLVKVVGSYYIFLLEASLILFLVADAIRLVFRLTGLGTEGYILYSGSIVYGALAVLLIVGSRNAWSPVVRSYEMDVDKSAQGGSARWTVAAASDIHLGNTVGRKHLRRLVERVNAMNPDVILLPGDVLDDSIEPFLRNRMGEVLGQLKAKHGIYAVLGNHEYFGGHIERYVQEADKLGIRVLRDEIAEVADSLYVVGRKDKTAESADGRADVAELTNGLDSSKPILMMDHQPTRFAQAADAGVDVMVSGHTHRGQFWPNHLFTRRLFELDWGYMRKGAMHVVVSSGFGSWGPPIRLGSRSEILKLTIRLKA